ncbi:MAG: SAF domain-containing protein [Microthrixaceae bacterium]
MIIVDKALQDRQAAGDPVRVGLVGSGFAGQGFVDQVTGHTPGMEISVVANRTLDGAAQAFRQIGIDDVTVVSTAAELDAAMAAHRPAITDDPTLVTGAERVEAVVEATGEIEFGSHTAVAAIENGKHLVLLNAELDCTLGPILKKRADAAGVVFTDADGDQPGVLMNLAREAEMMGFTPVVYGNIKSLLDHRRTPETQKAFAEGVFQRPKHITSFADGTKIAAEMACVANATGFGVSERGMEGPECKRVEEAVGLFDAEKMYLEGTGIVDYILGAEPSFGVFLLAHSDSWLHERYMKIYKMGEGPIYTFYRPYHLSPLETPLTVARAVLFNDATITPKGAPVTDVSAIAKFDLKAGDTLDGVGGFKAYGVMENSPVARAEDLLPMGLTDGCVLKRDLAQDTPITFADVELPAGRLSDQLWREQLAAF